MKMMQMVLLIECLGLLALVAYPRSAGAEFICDQDDDPNNNLHFFKFSRRSSKGHLEPYKHDHLCRSKDKTYCVFPQNTTFLHIFHKLNFENAPITYHPFTLFGTLRCGQIKEDWIYNASQLVPESKRQQFGEKYDDIVDWFGPCPGYPCPLAFVLHSPENFDYQGLYIANYPFAMKSLLGFGARHTPSYKHATKNLYLFSTDERGTEWIISRNLGYKKCDEEHVEIKVNVIYDDVPYDEMKPKYCFSMRKIKEWQVVEKGKSSGISHNVSKIAVKELPHQCGIAYKRDENRLLDTGLQPFIVSIEADGQKCVGTLISSKHIITLASCFNRNQDAFKINQTVMNKCILDNTQSWWRCQRWNRKNIGPDGNQVVVVKTFPSPLGKAGQSLVVDWIEVHPRFNGTEFDVAILGLRHIIQRTVNLHPICLPTWGRYVYKNYNLSELYARGLVWENNQVFYSLKALHYANQSRVHFTDRTGPARNKQCGGPCIKNLPPPATNEDLYIHGSLYSEEPENKIHHDNGEGDVMLECEYFYNIVEAEEDLVRFDDKRKQIRNMNQTRLDCFASVTLEFMSPKPRSTTCYERRAECLKPTGWCPTRRDKFGFCGLFNDLPKSPNDRHLLYELSILMDSKDFCHEGDFANSPTQICTTFFQEGPTEYVFEVKKDLWTDSSGDVKKRLIYSLKDHYGRDKRPFYVTKDKRFEGICYGSADNGAPTYLRVPIVDPISGNTIEGSHHAVLYGLQRVPEIKCDEDGRLSDIHVFIATDKVVEWINEVIKVPMKYYHHENITSLTVNVTIDKRVKLRDPYLSPYKDRHLKELEPQDQTWKYDHLLMEEYRGKLNLNPPTLEVQEPTGVDTLQFDPDEFYEFESDVDIAKYEIDWE